MIFFSLSPDSSGRQFFFISKLKDFNSMWKWHLKLNCIQTCLLGGRKKKWKLLYLQKKEREFSFGKLKERRKWKFAKNEKKTQNKSLFFEIKTNDYLRSTSVDFTKLYSYANFEFNFSYTRERSSVRSRHIRRHFELSFEKARQLPASHNFK